MPEGEIPIKGRWSDPTAALEKLFEESHQKGRELIQWYADKKKPMRLAAKVLRYLAVVTLGLGGFIPLYVLASNQSDSGTVSNLGYVFIAVSGLCLFVNRYLGFTTSWMRYIETQMQIEYMLDDFVLDWQELQSKLASKEPSEQEIAERLARIRQFHEECFQVVKKETEVWKMQYNQELSALESRLKPRSEGGERRPAAAPANP